MHVHHKSGSPQNNNNKTIKSYIFFLLLMEGGVFVFAVHDDGGKDGFELGNLAPSQTQQDVFFSSFSFFFKITFIFLHWSRVKLPR